MLAKRIIPCLDVKEGKVVKGINFKGLKEVGDPPTMAAEYEAQGADEITFLDITASLETRQTMLDIVTRTASNLFVPLTVGGGIRSVTDMRDALNAGADKGSVNSASNGPRGPRNWGRGRSSSRPWTRTASRTATTYRSPRP